ncbi:hypothetical protein D9758_015355 [Tetrapyrgos nigripes]|uniref:Uncharacterized protein n=1 Tax=Tetrapyrgos nigripes TaxID=182062 RepID=A0A8H5FNJ4_9AGAR|nr:hypothetical protein D9758_015355 [Tetrapyrgos nigripes]
MVSKLLHEVDAAALSPGEQLVQDEGDNALDDEDKDEEIAVVYACNIDVYSKNCQYMSRLSLLVAPVLGVRRDA